MIVLLAACIIFPPKNYNSMYKLSVVGPYGDNQSYHPKVLNFKDKWNGYKYWMSYTPYPNGDDMKENPCIAASNDLIHWKTPDGLVNPLDDPEVKEKAMIYNSDAHLVYNNDTNRMETYYRGEEEAMPYNTNGTLKVREFRGSSKSNILWTTKNTMRAWNTTRYLYGRPIPVGFAFKRSWEGGHSRSISTLCRSCI